MVSQNAKFFCSVERQGTASAGWVEVNKFVTASLIEEYNISITSRPDPTAGQDYTLTCEVVVSDGTPTLQWTGPGGETILEQSGTTLNLTFSPLNTSNGGEYTCQSTVGVGAVNRSATSTIIVQSKYPA